MALVPNLRKLPAYTRNIRQEAKSSVCPTLRRPPEAPKSLEIIGSRRLSRRMASALSQRRKRSGRGGAGSGVRSSFGASPAEACPRLARSPPRRRRRAILWTKERFVFLAPLSRLTFERRRASLRFADVRAPVGRGQ
eukprot:scaffold109_cov252-Pinguiococcus_pyrenoidosus.AAC.101